ERSPRRASPQDHLGMVGSGPTFRAHQVIGVIDPIEVRPLDPNWLLRWIHAGIKDHFPRSNKFLALQVKLLNPDRAVPIVLRWTFRWTIVEDVSPPIDVKE